MEHMSEEAATRHYADYRVFIDEIKRSGHFIACDRLQLLAAATVRVRDGKISATDGPFAETKEQLGGYFLIEAKNMDEAVCITSAHLRAWSPRAKGHGSCTAMRHAKTGASRGRIFSAIS